MDFGGAPRIGTAVEARAGCLCMGCTDAFWMLDVRPSPTVVARTQRDLGRCVLCSQSLPSRDRLLAKRVCRIAGSGMAPPSAASRAETRRTWPTHHCAARSRACGRLAYEPPERRDDELLARCAGDRYC